jgi:rhodanese-related sulfurtransferase
MKDAYTPLSSSQLRQTLEAGAPENDARSEGYTLVNVLPPGDFEREHIPGSINIPKERVEEFDERFDPDKKIVVYCGSHDCPASSEAAETLVRKGYEHVFDYEGGTQEWKRAGERLEGTAANDPD